MAPLCLRALHSPLSSTSEMPVRRPTARTALHLHPQPAARMMVLLVDLHVRRETRDPLGQQGDLNFRRTRVPLLAGELCHEFLSARQIEQ